MLLQMVDQLDAERVPGEEAFNLHQEVHSLAEALLETEPVVLCRGGRHGGVRNAVHAVLGVRMRGRHGRVLGF